MNDRARAAASPGQGDEQAYRQERNVREEDRGRGAKEQVPGSAWGKPAEDCGGLQGIARLERSLMLACTRCFNATSLKCHFPDGVAFSLNSWSGTQTQKSNTTVGPDPQAAHAAFVRWLEGRWLLMKRRPASGEGDVFAWTEVRNLIDGHTSVAPGSLEPSILYLKRGFWWA